MLCSCPATANDAGGGAVADKRTRGDCAGGCGGGAHAVQVRRGCWTAAGQAARRQAASISTGRSRRVPGVHLLQPHCPKRPRAHTTLPPLQGRQVLGAVADGAGRQISHMRAAGSSSSSSSSGSSKAGLCSAIVTLATKPTAVLHAASRCVIHPASSSLGKEVGVTTGLVLWYKEMTDMSWGLPACLPACHRRSS